MGANTLTVAAEATNSLRIATLVYDVDYRHPVTLAKEIATLDLISEGEWSSASVLGGCKKIIERRNSVRQSRCSY